MMKGMIHYLTPFAPDQSGAVSALYGMGGLIVICDAGGCTGNICGFDEPRWFRETGEMRSAIFSAGLRDMDAILGRDDLLIGKLVDAADHTDASFIALIGTPVPAMIATDFQAMARRITEQTGLPVLTPETTGTGLYDEGEREAYRALFRTFAKKDTPACGEKVLGVIGCTPLDLSRLKAEPAVNAYAKAHGFSGAACYGMGAGLSQVRKAGSVWKNLVVSPAGIAAAEYLKETFGTPYEVGFPFFGEAFRRRLSGLDGRRILIVHQQAAANVIRGILSGVTDADLVCGTWFLQLPELAGEPDVRFERERDFISFAQEGNFDVIIGDPSFRRALVGYKGEYVDCPHYAVSGILEEE